MRSRVLVIDDDEAVCEVAASVLAPVHEVATCTSAREGLALLLDDDFDVLLCDLRMPELSGTEVIAQALRSRPDLAVVLLTGEGSLEAFTELLRMGVLDFVLKPFRPADLVAAVDRALRLRQLRAENLRMAAELDEQAPVPGLVAEGEAMREVARAILKVAPTEATVLVTGESGTGKDVVARALHALSSRADGPFVAVSCGALAGSLLESEIFGHARGAFTDAHEARRGCFEAAANGTLLLDEIGATAPDLQVRLLRVLAEREVTRVGESRPRRVDVRVVAATNADLRRLVEEERFREDLLFRLDVVRIHLPPLRERGDADVEALAKCLLERACRRLGRRPRVLDPGARDCLLSHSWPGNVRELENALERAVLLAGASEVLGADDLGLVAVGGAPAAVGGARAAVGGAPAAVSGAPAAVAGRPALPDGGIDLRQALTGVESRLIDQALERCAGNRTQAAALLGLRRTALVEKLRRRSAAAATSPQRRG